MDSLIVLRRPLRKTQVEPKFIIPKKSKKAQPKLAPIPPSPESTQPISFVKLYKEACVSSQASRAAWPLEALQARGPRSSLASLVTQYAGRRQHDPPPAPCRAARAELILELEYDNRSKDSAFASTTNSVF